MYFNRYKRLKLVNYNDFLIEKDKLYVEQRGSLYSSSPEKDYFFMKDYLIKKFKKKKKKFI